MPNIPIPTEDILIPPTLSAQVRESFKKVAEGRVVIDSFATDLILQWMRAMAVANKVVNAEEDRDELVKKACVATGVDPSMILAIDPEKGVIRIRKQG